MTPEAKTFLTTLHERFNPRRMELLKKREKRQERINQGDTLNFLPETAAIRNDPTWRVAPIPADIRTRDVEITGPTDRKMVINALNSGADVFMADFEDSNSPTWTNIIDGQKNLIDAVNGTISYESPDGKQYTLHPKTAALFVRPRGWHLPEKHFLINDEPISGSLFDFGLFFFHNAKTLIQKGKTPSFYLAKTESHLEARLWNDVFSFAENALSIPHGTLRATVLIETLPAAFEMEEILFELKEYSAGLNAGRWDYLFSIIKTFQQHSTPLFPCRDALTMTVPFMRAYTQLLVQSCHKRNAYAIGGMAAFIPNKNDPQATEIALQKVREDKMREVNDGFQGTWVAHPGLVPLASEIFKTQPKGTPKKTPITADDLLNFHIPNASVTEKCLRQNITISLEYMSSWLAGKGAAALHNLMEDVATAEIARAQVWQWIQRGAVTRALVQTLIKEESQKVSASPVATQLIETLTLTDTFIPFLTLPAYTFLE